MKPNQFFKLTLTIITVMIFASCSLPREAQQSSYADDVYVTKVDQKVYAQNTRSEEVYSDQNPDNNVDNEQSYADVYEYDYDSYEYGLNYSSRLNNFYRGSLWRPYYNNDNFSLYGNSYFPWYSSYSYGLRNHYSFLDPWYAPSFGWGIYDGFGPYGYGYGSRWGLGFGLGYGLGYPYYMGGGYYGNGWGNNVWVGGRPGVIRNNPRPERGVNNPGYRPERGMPNMPNSRPTGRTQAPVYGGTPQRSTGRPDPIMNTRPESRPSNNSTRPTRPERETSAPAQRPSNNSTRPTRPERETSAPTQRPTRVEQQRPTYSPPANSGGGRSQTTGGGGSSTGGRPTRGGN